MDLLFQNMWKVTENMIRANTQAMEQLSKLSGSRMIASGQSSPFPEGNTIQGQPSPKKSPHRPDMAKVRPGQMKKTVPESSRILPEKKKEKGKKENRKQRKELEVLLDPSRYTASGVSREDLEHIIGLYGSSVEDIYELGAGQRWMLEEGKHVKNAFFLQILTKAVIPFDLPAFRHHADEVCKSYENLRSAFVMDAFTQPYRVVLKDRQPEINCFDLSDLDMDEFDEKVRKYMDSDRQRGFNLEKDPLLRISIYKSCEKDTYAMILSQPHVNSDGTSLGLLFKDLFIGYALDMNGIDQKLASQTYQSYAEHLKQVDTKEELSFWKQYLDGVAEDQLLPGQKVSNLDYDSTSLFVPFEEEELDILKEARKKYGVTQNTLLQGLWGLMSAKLKNRDHIVFGAVTAGRDAEVSESMMLAGGFVNAIPVKVTCRPEERLSDYFKQLQADFVNCMKNSHCSPGQIKDALGRREDVFSHILNNHNFAKPKSGGFSQGGFSGIRFIGGDVYDNLSADLCVYFTTVDGKSGCNFSFNARAFSKEVIQLLAEDLKCMIAALKDAPADKTIGMLPALDVDMIYHAEDTRKNEQLKIAGSLKKHPVFSNAEDEELLNLASFCHLGHFAEDEMIVRKGDALQKLPILLKGRAIVFGETKEGWNNPLRIKKAGSILSFTPLFEDEKTNNLVTSGMDGSIVLFIPQEALLTYLFRHPESMIEISRLIYQERNIFIKLWTNAD